MKNQLHSACVLMAVFALFIAACQAPAQNDSVTISAAEFQRLAYSAHLHAQLAEKPELDPVLQVLLELQCRNPHADPAALASVLTNALHRYRANAPAYIRTNGFRDEIFAAYLDALLQAPARTNFIPANLTLLNGFMLGPDDYNPNLTPAQQFDPLIDSGNQRLFSSEGESTKRQAVVDNCVARAQANAAFATVLDKLLTPETLVSLRDSPAVIIGNTNSPLHENLTMQALLALSAASGDGSLTVSSNQLMNLFTKETQTLWDTIHTNLALRAEINQRQPDLLAYLTNQDAIDTDAQREAVIKRNQARTIASSTAAILVQSRLQEAKDPLIPLPKEMKAVGSFMSSIATGLNMMGSDKASGLTKVMASGNLIGAGLQVLNLLTGTEAPEDRTAREIDNIKILVGDLSNNMDYRFDRVDQSLTTLFNQLNNQFSNIVIIGGKIDHISGSVDDIRRRLVDVQGGLDRLEHDLFTDFNYAQRSELDIQMNGALFYEIRNPNSGPMNYATYSQIPDGPEIYFLTYATSKATGEFSSPSGFTVDELKSSALNQQLAIRPLDANLNYIQEFLSTTLGQRTAGDPPLANPRDWFAGAYAYLQLAVENPMLFREKGLTMGGICTVGTNLTDFFRSLTFTGTNINRPLHDALVSYYAGKLATFTGQLQSTQLNYASLNGFVLDTLRQWDPPAPRFTATATTVLESHVEPPVIPLELIPVETRAQDGIIALAGDHNGSHGLALQAEGRVAAWGRNDYGQAVVPAGLSNVVAIAAGVYHSLALRRDRTVVGWGAYDYLTNTPVTASNVVAIGTGQQHNLAVRADGSVVGWGYNYDGQATGVPTVNYPPFDSAGIVKVAGQPLSNVVAVDGGINYSLALKGNGQVVAWGNNDNGQTNVPAGLNSVMAITAGGYHSLALRSNGTVIAWGLNNAGQTSVPSALSNIVAVDAGAYHSLALRGDGTLIAWGNNSFGQTDVPLGLSNVVAIAADQMNSVALRNDGTLVAWGFNNWLWQGPRPVPPGLSNVVAVSAGSAHCLALRADGSLAAWGDNQYGQTTLPEGLSKVAAIAAGDYHSLALKADGTVAAWGTGQWNYNQTNVPQKLTNVVAIAAGAEYSVALKGDGRIVSWGRTLDNAPVNLSSVVAVAAARYHCLALTMDGRVRAWGLNDSGQCNVPTTATNIIAVAAGTLHNLALRADSTVVAWGNNSSGECTVPAGLNNVVAIAAGGSHSVALKRNGSVVTWGGNYYSQRNVPREATNVLAVAANWNSTLLLTDNSSANTPVTPPLTFIRAPQPGFVIAALQAANELLLTGLDGGLHPSAAELSGAKALLQAVLELGMSHTLERDDVLHGFLYGSESLPDLDVARIMFANEIARLGATPFTPPARFEAVAPLRFACFTNRLEERLKGLQAAGQPEIPRLVGHTLRLLNLLRDSWTGPTSSPPPALEIGLETNVFRLVLYGEPHTHYALQYSSSLSVPSWTTTTITNEQIITPPVSSVSRGFYRALLPVP